MYILWLLLFLPNVLSAETCDPDDVSCLLIHDNRTISLVRVRPEQNATLSCEASSNNDLKFEWWVGRRSALIVESDRFHVYDNGSLQIFHVNRDIVEE
jgi:hypothetical protein